MFEQKSDTGLKLELLQKYVFIPLDIFRENQQNKSIEKKLDAWLTLLSYEEPEKIIELIKKYPEFRKIYEEGSEICRNTERVMEMFSKYNFIVPPQDFSDIEAWFQKLKEMIIAASDKPYEEVKELFLEMAAFVGKDIVNFSEQNGFMRKNIKRLIPREKEMLEGDCQH